MAITNNIYEVPFTYIANSPGFLDGKIYWNTLKDAIDGINKADKIKGFKFIVKDNGNGQPAEYWFTEDYIPKTLRPPQDEYIPEPKLYINETDPMSLDEFKQINTISGVYYIMNDSEPILDNYTLDHIEINGPTKNEYKIGDALNLNGLEMKKVYKQNNSDSFVFVLSFNFTTNLKNGTILDTAGIINIIIDNNPDLKATITVTEN